MANEFYTRTEKRRMINQPKEEKEEEPNIHDPTSNTQQEEQDRKQSDQQQQQQVLSTTTTNPPSTKDGIEVLCTGKYPKLVLLESSSSSSFCSNPETYDDLLDVIPWFYSQLDAGGETTTIAQRVPVVRNRKINHQNHSVTTLRELVIDLTAIPQQSHNRHLAMKQEIIY